MDRRRAAESIVKMLVGAHGFVPRPPPPPHRGHAMIRVSDEETLSIAKHEYHVKWGANRSIARLRQRFAELESLAHEVGYECKSWLLTLLIEEGRTPEYMALAREMFSAGTPPRPQLYQFLLLRAVPDPHRFKELLLQFCEAAPTFASDDPLSDDVDPAYKVVLEPVAEALATHCANPSLALRALDIMGREPRRVTVEALIAACRGRAEKERVLAELTARYHWPPDHVCVVCAKLLTAESADELLATYFAVWSPAAARNEFQPMLAASRALSGFGEYKTAVELLLGRLNPEAAGGGGGRGAAGALEKELPRETAAAVAEKPGDRPQPQPQRTASKHGENDAAAALGPDEAVSDPSSQPQTRRVVSETQIGAILRPGDSSRPRNRETASGTKRSALKESQEDESAAKAAVNPDAVLPIPHTAQAGTAERLATPDNVTFANAETAGLPQTEAGRGADVTPPQDGEASQDDDCAPTAGSSEVPAPTPRTGAAAKAKANAGDAERGAAPEEDGPLGIDSETVVAAQREAPRPASRAAGTALPGARGGGGAQASPLDVRQQNLHAYTALFTVCRLGAREKGDYFYETAFSALPALLSLGKSVTYPQVLPLFEMAANFADVAAVERLRDVLVDCNRGETQAILAEVRKAYTAAGTPHHPNTRRRPMHKQRMSLVAGD
eukprot:gene5632-8586_t